MQHRFPNAATMNAQSGKDTPHAENQVLHDPAPPPPVYPTRTATLLLGWVNLPSSYARLDAGAMVRDYTGPTSLSTSRFGGAAVRDFGL